MYLISMYRHSHLLIVNKLPSRENKLPSDSISKNISS
jgi:hypothetical protein